jgi:hypothetical protein
MRLATVPLYCSLYTVDVFLWTRPARKKVVKVHNRHCTQVQASVARGVCRMVRSAARDILNTRVALVRLRSERRE